MWVLCCVDVDVVAVPSVKRSTVLRVVLRICSQFLRRYKGAVYMMYHCSWHEHAVISVLTSSHGMGGILTNTCKHGGKS